MYTNHISAMNPGILSENVLINRKYSKSAPAHDQLVTRPAIDEVICHYLDGEMLKEALFVIDNIRENNMKIKWTSINVWSVLYKRKHVCDICIGDDSLSIGPISGVLATHVANASYDHKNIMQLIGALRSAVAGTPEAICATS